MVLSSRPEELLYDGDRASLSPLGDPGEPLSSSLSSVFPIKEFTSKPRSGLSTCVEVPPFLVELKESENRKKHDYFVVIFLERYARLKQRTQMNKTHNCI